MAQTKEHWTWNEKAWIQVPGLPRARCVTRGVVLDNSGPHMPHQKYDDGNTTTGLA